MFVILRGYNNSGSARVQSKEPGYEVGICVACALGDMFLKYEII